MEVGPIQTPAVRGPGPVGEPGSTVARGSGGVPFAQLMSHFLQDANQQQQAVTHGLHELVSGNADNVHDVAIRVAQADISFRMVMEIRDQLISAYQEVMRMQV